VTDRPRLRFYTTEQLGEKQAETPEGFLLCQDVPIARVGTQLYAGTELPGIEPGPDGTITVERHPEEVFDEKTIASFNGKSVVITHPPNGVRVTPDNWRDYEVGLQTNIRRGEAPLNPDYLYADFLVKDPRAIRLIRTKQMREVSAGYDAAYEQLGPGRARQYDIIGNHTALVERGRCGPSCAVGDTAEELSNMGVRDALAAVRDSIGKARRAARTGDAEGAVEELDKIPDMIGKVVSGDDLPPDTSTATVPGTEPHHVTVNIHNPPGSGAAAVPPVDDAPEDAGAAAAPAGDVPSQLAEIMARLEAIEEAIAVLAGGDEPDGDEGEGGEEAGEGSNPDEGGEATDPTKKAAAEPGAEGGEKPDEEKPVGDKKVTGDARPRASVGDSTSMRALFQQTISRAAILVPDVRVPTFDSAKPATFTADALCQLRRDTLRRAWGADDVRPTLETLLAGRTPDFTTKAMTCDAAAVIFDAASELLRAERAKLPLRTSAFRAPAGALPAVPTPAQINARNRERFGIKI
jgi:hypothetical protein